MKTRTYRATVFSIYFLLVAVCFCFALGHCWEKADCVTYYGNTKEPLKCFWTPGNVGEYYSTLLRFWHVEWDELAFKTETQEDRIEVYLVSSGHYIIQAKTRQQYTEAQRASKVEELVTRQDILDHMVTANCDHIDLGADPSTFTDDELRDAVLAFGESSSVATSFTDGEVDGVDRAWWVHTWPAPPESVVIE